MGRKSVHKILIIILLFGSVQTLFAQKDKATKESGRDWFVGMNGGINVFYGDIKFNTFWPASKLHELQAGGSFVFGKTFSPTIKLSSELNLTSLRGRQELLIDTLGFKTQALSIALKGHLNPIAIFNKKHTKFAFYFESGVGIMTWKSQNQSSLDTLNKLGWSNPNKEIGFYIPAGIQIEYQITSRFSTHLTSNYNVVFSDLLDGKAIGGFDSYGFTALGINYHFGKQKEVPKLLPYSFFDIGSDIIKQPLNQENKSEKSELDKTLNNPFTLTFKVPEKAPTMGLDISINIAKLGIPSSGFFQLLVPSSFLPQAASKGDVIFTKLGNRYEYDFILPMNQDSTNIPIHINLSEIENGTYPILIEGEIMDQKGKVFPIKFATYTEIISEGDWQKLLSIEEQKRYAAKKTKENLSRKDTSDNIKDIEKKVEIPALQNAVETFTPKNQKASDEGVYRIQIMAGKKQYADLTDFKSKHKITENIFITHDGGWYHYNIYQTKDKNEAKRICSKVRSENNIPQSFVSYYENGKRILIVTPKQREKPGTSSAAKTTQKSVISSKTKQKQDNRLFDNIFTYRIEIAMAYNKPIPLYILQHKVGHEKIHEFVQDLTYFYTIGKFDDLFVARAFLGYVKLQFKIETAQIGQYQNDKRIKGIL